MHHLPGATVRQNVFVATIKDPERRREIDVLIDGSLAGYPVRIGIECKNRKTVVGVEQVDSFIAKLDDVGIPRQQGIFVAIAGFTRGAIARAKKEGIRTLVLTGLTEERLSSEINDAIQAVIHLWPIVTRWTVQNTVSSIDGPQDLGIFFDDQGKICGSAADLAWRAWMSEEIPAELGSHNVKLRLPVGWRHIIKGATSIPSELSVHVQVYGVAVTAPGTAVSHALVNAQTGNIEKVHVQAGFTSDFDRMIVRSFPSEDALSAYLAELPAPFRLLTRARLPRIQWYRTFWPGTVELLNALSEAQAAGLDPNTADLGDLEQPTLSRMWEPVCHTAMLDKILQAKFE